MSARLTLLYVDDDPDIREVATMSLELDPGITVLSAGSGEEALQLLAAADWLPDAILLDVMMAGMDGPALAARIRSQARFATVPLLFMTARARPSDMAEYHALGAAGVIPKPFDPMRLAGEIRDLVAAARA